MSTLSHEDDNQPEEPTTVQQERNSMYCFVSGNGNLVFDRHPSDEGHLQAGAQREQQPLYDCRVYLRDLFPQAWQGKRGTLRVSRMTTTKKTVVSISFTPDE